jgi:hypothetical protein
LNNKIKQKGMRKRKAIKVCKNEGKERKKKEKRNKIRNNV